MNKRLPLIVGGIIFTIVAVIHLLRLYYHWDVVIAGQIIPMSVSVVGFIVPIILAFWMFIAANRK